MINFHQKTAHEFITGSAISPDLFRATVDLVDDIEVLPGGEVRYPIHEALNWRVTRFGHQTRANQQAAILRNEDGSPWQAKLSNPRIDTKKGKAQRYETPLKNGLRAFLPAVDLETWVQVAQQNQLSGFLPSWVKEAVANRQKDLLSNVSHKLTPDEFENCAARLKLIFAMPSPKATSAAKGFSSPTEKSISQNSQRQQTCISEKIQTIPCDTSDLTQTTESIPSRLLQTSSGSSQSASKYLTSPLRESQRLQTQFPIETSSFWEWVELLPVQIVWTEGGKKALCLLSLGYVAIGLYGVNGGHRSTDALKNPIDPTLTPDVLRFAQPGRRHTLAFDQDSKQETRRKVERVLTRFGGLLEVTGGTVSIATWKPEQGKGVDDLVVQGGSVAWESAHSNALPLQYWQIWQRLENRLTWQPSIKVSTHDLSTLSLEQLPQSGIIAIAAGKGTGKTKLTAQLVQGQEKVLAANHRIALCRNVCERLKLDYRGDLDKTPDGQFITGSGYTLRVGSCIDALLAINPAQFADCDLVIDEAVQVVRHLLSSSTCAQDGKRPALLSRFHELIQIARRVVLADADLDNATLHYIQELRGDEAPVFLIRNDLQSKTYPTRFIQANSFESVVCEILDDLHQLEPGKTLFVATDNKRVTKAIARLIATSCPEKQVLVINSETSGGEAEREFIQTPDTVLQRGDHDIIIASPSLATGVSIEAQGIITRVYGIFSGVSSNDADIAQSLARVREPVERVVWVVQHGRNWSKVSRSTNPLTIKTALMQQTSVNVSLIRSSLREDTIASVQGYDWQSDPHLNLYCKLAAEQNRSMQHLRDAVLVRLQHEGHQVIIEDREYDPVARFLYRQAANEQKRHDAQAIANAKVLTYLEAKVLEQQESRSPEDERALQRFHLCEFYAIDPDSLTVEFVLWDADGRRRGELLSLEAMIYPDTAIDATARALEKQAKWNKGNCPWDISRAALRQKMRQLINLDKYLDPDREWVAADLAEDAAIVRQHSKQIQDVLHFTPSEKLSDVQIIHQLLSQLGLKVTYRWQGTGAEKHRVYRLDSQCWQGLTLILERRQGRRLRFQQENSGEGSPPPLNTQIRGGDPKFQASPELEKWLSPECLADVRSMWEEANTPELIEEVKRIVPPEVLEIAIAS